MSGVEVEDSGVVVVLGLIEVAVRSSSRRRVWVSGCLHMR